MSYVRLTREERYQIKGLLQTNFSIQRIARELGRSASTISREISRNSIGGKYSPVQATSLASLRRAGVGPKKKISGYVRLRIKDLLRKDWSPDQIVGRLRRTRSQCVCAETIYQFIYRDKRDGGDLWTHLKRKRRSRWSRTAIRNIREGKRNYHTTAKPIEDRPVDVNTRDRFGDFERDLIIDRQKYGILTIIERLSRRVILEPIGYISSSVVHQKTSRALKGCQVRTLTNDNGAEFARHKETEKALGASVYFANPKRRGQCGTVENANGLLRRYFPRGTNISKLTRKEIKIVQEKLNNRPRKCLGYLTPNEVFNKMNGCCSKN